ncbi:MAG: DUF2147 domain-containing protein [Sphingobacteriales bacterium]|nr:MAG: DUF2147 domain-containing protein [Sphingobacteriales bacterium]
MKQNFTIGIAFFLACCTTLSLLSAITLNSADKVIGKWLNEEQDGAVEIFKKGDSFYGKLIWLKKGPNTLDEKNPDASKQKLKLLGKEILQNFTYTADSKLWQNGTIYDPKSGKTYSCKMWLNDNGSLSIRGYIGFSFIGRTTVWTRPSSSHPVNL